jgi:hypothetical protein
MRFVIFALAAVLAATAAASAPLNAKPTPTPSASPSGPPDMGSMPYDKYTATAQAQHGLFTIWRNKGDVGIELRPDQFNKDYVELSVPVNGIGAGIFSGITDLAPVRIIRFVQQDDKVAVLLPSTRFLADKSMPVANAVEVATAPTVVGVGKVLAVDRKTGNVVFDASPLLQDVTDIGDALTQFNGGELNPLGSYHIDPQQSYFDDTKAFPDNVIINVSQTFTSLKPTADVLSVAPDARSLQMTVQYNIAAIPQDDSYIPRLYDDRVGYFVNAHYDFSSDDLWNKDRNYIVRWNIQASDPSKPVSPAVKPVVYYLSNTIPVEYRAPIRSALLEWNKAFERIGISNVVVVKDQPNDPNFDPDDIRYNVIRWLTETEGGFAEAQLLYNPYTGEMIKSGVVIDSDLMRFGKFQYPVLAAPQARSPIGRALGMGTFADGERRNFGLGVVALSAARSDGGYGVPQWFTNDFIKSIVMHESGHDWGLRHNFIGSEAYTAKELQSKAFTSRYGVASSVMEYSPINIWPKGTPQGDYFQTVLGPYDYFVIHWGYAPVPGAKTSDAELPTLRRWASSWTLPRHRWSSDEDVDWYDGPGYDPRNQQWDLTDDNIGWCQVQMHMMRDLLVELGSRFPKAQAPFDDLQTAFGFVLGNYGSCGMIVARYLDGEYVSRSLRGDPNEQTPLSPIPLVTQKRAFEVIDREILSASAWNVSPELLRHMVTQYRYDDWLGNLPQRHDIALEQLALTYQTLAISQLYTPTALQRLDDMDFKYGSGTTMDIEDLFAWMQQAIFADVSPKKSIPLIERNLQRSYTAMLSKLMNAPDPGTPADAQALARYELQSLHEAIGVALREGVPDVMTRAHLADMDADIERALQAHVVIQSHGLT